MSQRVEQDQEVNLGDLFAAVLHNWWVVLCSVIVSVVAFGYFAFFVAIPEYRVSTRFELLSNEDTGTSSLAQVAGIAAIAGINLAGNTSEAEALADRILSRPFVESIYSAADFGSDPVFNAALREPNLVARIKALLLGNGEPEPISKDQYLVMAVGALSERMEIIVGDNGITELSLTHTDGGRAAEVANLIVAQSLVDIFERARGENRAGLEYFASELLKIRSDLDDASAAVRDYAVNNSLQSAEELARISAQLSQVRRELQTLEEGGEALDSLKSGTILDVDFANDHPVVSSLMFRRLLGLSGNPNQWRAVEKEELENAIDSVNEQKSSLLRTFNTLTERARNSGNEAFELAALEREVEVQQTIYESVVTQFEARSLYSGYEPASGRIIEEAIASTLPYTPRKSLLLMFGLVVGMFAALFAIIFIGWKRGNLYTLNAIVRSFDLPDYCKLDRSQIAKVTRSNLNPLQFAQNNDLLVQLEESSRIVGVFPLGTIRTAAGLSFGLAKSSAMCGKKTALIDLSKSLSSKFDNITLGSLADAFQSIPISERFDLLWLKEGLPPLSGNSFTSFLSSVESEYSRVIVLAPSIGREPAVNRLIAQAADAAIISSEIARTSNQRVDKFKSILAKAKLSTCLLVVS